MGSASSLGGSVTSDASDALTTVAVPNASTSPSADPSGRRFADASVRRLPRESKSYAGRGAAYEAAAAAAYNDVYNGVFTLEELAHVNSVAGTDFDLDDYRHVSEWCPTRPSPIIAPVEAVHIVTAARAEAEQPREELQPHKGVNRLFSPKAKRREDTPAAGADEGDMQARMLLRNLLNLTTLANAAMAKFQETEAAGLREKYGRKLVPRSLIELLRGPRSPEDWDEIDDLLASAVPDDNVAERRLCALTLSLQTLSDTIHAGPESTVNSVLV
jgi:hypothetical protein